MPTLLHSPDAPLLPEELDAYLTNGWRPTGQSLYTSDFLRTDDDALYGCLQLRLPLAEFSFKKRHRRLLRKNDQLFRVVIEKATLPDAEMLAVNKAYLKLHPQKSTENLGFHVVGERFLAALNTQVTKVYVGKKMIGFSYFDVGKKCLYSKAGIYDPAFKDYSLGIYTMLLEIRWALDNGYAFYHPGYFAPAYPIFNYKLKFGPVEYRDPISLSWQPLTAAPENHPQDPYRLVEDKLIDLQKAFRTADISARLLEYPSYTARFYYANSNLNENDLLDGPLLLAIKDDSLPDELVVTYHLSRQQYQCFETARSGMRDFKLRPLSPVNGRARFGRPAAIFRLVAQSATATGLLQHLRTLSRP